MTAEDIVEMVNACDTIFELHDISHEIDLVLLANTTMHPDDIRRIKLLREAFYNAMCIKFLELDL